MATIRLIEKLERAARAAIESQIAGGGTYQWGERDCGTLITAVCRSLGLPAPPYGPWWAKTERKALSDALKRWKSLGAAHAGGLKATRHWLELQAWDVWRPCDVVSVGGSVLCADGTAYNPPRAGAELTGVVGPSMDLWVWGKQGLTTVDDEMRVTHLTRPIAGTE